MPWLPRVSHVVEAVDTSLRDLLARNYPWPMVRRDLAHIMKIPTEPVLVRGERRQPRRPSEAGAERPHQPTDSFSGPRARGLGRF